MKSIFNFFIKRYVKNYTDVNSPSVREAYGTLGGVVGLIINSSILIIELITGLLLNSVAITADAFHNMTDALSSAITIVSFKLANRPADDEHPFGHGRIEYITALLFSAVILLVGYEFLKNSINRILHPVIIPFVPAVFLLMLLALPLQIFLNRFTSYIGKIIDSSALKASAVESFTDILVLTIVILSLLLTHFTSLPVDGYAGLIVSVFILHSGFELGKDTVDTLVGKAPDREFAMELVNSVLSYPNIRGVHDLVIHNYGPGKYMASLHAEVPFDMPIMEIHDIIDKIEKDIGTKMNIYLSIHMDPVKTDSPEINSLKGMVQEKLNQMPEILSMHDFRVIGETEEKTLLFDVVVDKSYLSKIEEEKLKAKIQETVSTYSKTFRCIITIDRDYC